MPIETLEKPAEKPAEHTFTGRYAKQSAEIYRDARNYFGIGHEQAIRLAESFAADFGAAIKNGVITSEAKVGRVGKEQEVTLEDMTSVKAKNAVATASMRLVRIIAQVNKLNREGDMLYSGTEIGLKPVLLEWLTGQKPT